MFYEIMHRESCVAQLSTTGECKICLEDFMPCDLVLELLFLVCFSDDTT